MKKHNTKGFSLVELIVVIAIMAVLVGVLAPSLLRYVEKTRIQKDASAVAEVCEAAKIALADEKINKDTQAGAKLVLTQDATSKKYVLTESGPDSGADATKNTLLAPEVKLTVGDLDFSGKDAGTVTIVVNIDTNGIISFTCSGGTSGSDWATAIAAVK